MKEAKTPYDKQIFVCTNNKEGKDCSCADNKGEEVFRSLREIAKLRGLHPRIRVAQAKCLGQCNEGVNIMVYPDNVWLSSVRMEDVENIANQYIVS